MLKNVRNHQVADMNYQELYPHETIAHLSEFKPLTAFSLKSFDIKMSAKLIAELDAYMASVTNN